jgi:hypothetical protein
MGASKNVTGASKNVMGASKNATGASKLFTGAINFNRYECSAGDGTIST